MRVKLIKNFQSQKAQTLILAYVFLVFLIILVAAFLNKAANENRLVQRQRLTQEVLYLAEGGIEDALCQFSNEIANFAVAPDIAVWPPQPTPVPDPPDPHTTTYSSFHNAEVYSVIVRLEDLDRVVPVEGGINALVRNYDVTATAEHPFNAGIGVTLHQVVARRIIPAFQHAVFYEDDLEILPGPDMTFSGRIHSNDDIYIGCHNTLTVDSEYLRSAGNIYNKRKNDGTRMGAGEQVSIRIKDSAPAAYDLMKKAGVYLDSDHPNWTTESQTRWGGTVKNAMHGVTRLAAPQVGSIQPDGYYANQADVVIVNDTISQGGLDLLQGVDVPVGTVGSSISFYNNREDKTVKMTEIDLNKLAGYAPGDPPGSPSFPNHLPTNGLLYATRDDAGALFQPGIRLVNGGQINRAEGLNVVTNDPLYIQGNYNTDSKKPAAVICDSLNLLSSAWDDDAKSLAPLNQRVAAETTVNTAFIAGIDETDPAINQYNGGLENYPRMHEQWSGKNLNIRGAFLALWNSQIATGAWQYGSPQYEAPKRNWDYDTDFNDTSKLPPFTPWAVEMYRVSWWKD